MENNTVFMVSRDGAWVKAETRREDAEETMANLINSDKELIKEGWIEALPTYTINKMRRTKHTERML